MPTAEQQYQGAHEADLARQEQWRTRELEYEAEVKRQQLWYRRQQEEDLARQQEMTQTRMGWGVFLVALILSLIADVVEFFTVGTLGWFVGLIVDLILLAILGFSKAGKKQFKKWVWGPLIEKIPILATVPFFRAAFLIWAFVSSRSKTIQSVSAVATAGFSKKAA